MRRIWILNHYAVTPASAGGTRHFSLASNLNRLGWRCTIIASDTNHVSGLDEFPEIEHPHLTDYEDVEFLWLKTAEYHGNGFARVRGMFQYFFSVLKKHTTNTLERPDVVVGSSVHPLAALAGAILAKRYRVPFVYEIRDLWPETLIQMGSIKRKSLPAIILRRLERYLVSRAELVVSLLPHISTYFETHHMSPRKTLWLSNGVDLESFPFTEANDTGGAPLSIVYFGAHGQANGLDVVINALKLFKDANGADLIKMRFIGEGPGKNKLIERAEALGLTEFDISFEPQVLKAEIPAIAAEADAFIISVLDLPELYKYGISMNKLFDYLAAARPVLIASSAPNNPVDEANCGYSSPAQDAETLAINLRLLSESTAEQRKNMGRAGRDHLIENYTFEKLSKRLSDELDILI